MNNNKQKLDALVTGLERIVEQGQGMWCIDDDAAAGVVPLM
jgi:hypothetical protein